MGAWSLYFLAKFGLHLIGLIKLAPLLNLALALGLSWPLPAQARRDAASPPDSAVPPRSLWLMRLRRLRPWLALPLAGALLYQESFLPSLSRLVDSWSAISTFSADYLLELGTRFLNPALLAALAGGVALWWIGRRRLRWAGWVWVGLIAVALQTGTQTVQGWLAPAVTDAAGRESPYDISLTAAKALVPAQLDDYVARFYATERGKVLHFPTQGEPGFDLLILSICSLSWDDIEFAGLSDAPLLKRLDVVFRQFNSAASYSGPAVLRLLHASCGQVLQPELYGAAPAACYLLRNLERAGFAPHLLLNHDGKFDGFAEQLRAASGVGLQTGATLPGGAALPVTMHSFDGSPILDDFALLSPWWRDHAAGNQPVALLYNTISLHDGNQVPGLNSRFSLDTYKPRARKLFADLERLLAQIEASARPTVVVLVPEHGGAVRGDAGQIAGLRDYPTAPVTHVPAGVALFNLGRARKPGEPPVVVEQVSSYTSLFTVVASLLHGGLAAAEPDRLAEVAKALPPIAWVAENEAIRVVRQGGHSFLQLAGSSWRDLGR
jgi:cellulose synthase operon protein YhjU